MKKTQFLDGTEQKLIGSLENGGWQPAANLPGWKAKLAKAAANTLAKNQRLNIRVTQSDLTGIKLRAAEEGLPYQTLISSIIHKYLSGQLIDRQKPLISC